MIYCRITSTAPPKSGKLSQKKWEDYRKMIIDLQGTDKLNFFKDLYDEAKSLNETHEEQLRKNYEQYKGSAEIDDSAVPASQVRNITYELIESQITTYIPTPSVRPKLWSEKNERNAKSIEVLLKNKRDELPFEGMNDIDERYNPIYGGSVWLVEWDESIITHNTVGDVKLSCLSPSRFVGQPNIYNISDMEYCFIEFDTTKEDIMRKYGVSEQLADQAEAKETENDRTATLCVCYYKDDEDRVCQYIWSGDVELSDISDYYARKRYICKKCGKRKEICTCETQDKKQYVLQNEDFEEIDRDITLSDGSVIPAMSTVIKDGQIVTDTVQRNAVTPDGQMAYETINGIYAPIMRSVATTKKEKTKIPFYRPTLLPIVIRKNTSQEDSLLGQSDCQFIRPQQQAINKIESRIMQKLMGSGVYPIVPDDFSDDLDNSIFKKSFRVNQSNYNLFGRIDLQTDVSRDIAEAERLYDQAKRMLGITDSYQGQYDSSAKSGVAKQLQIQQSSGRLDSKRQMKNAAYADIDHIIFQFYLAYADEPRPASYKDAEGRMQNVGFNRYEFVERDESGEYYYNDQFLFSADASVDISRSRETLWQENRQNFTTGAYGDPALPQTQLIFWLNMESAHYPYAHDNVERLRSEIRQQTAMLTQQNQQLQQEVANRREYEEYLLNQSKGIRTNGGTI